MPISGAFLGWASSAIVAGIPACQSMQARQYSVVTYPIDVEALAVVQKIAPQAKICNYPGETDEEIVTYAQSPILSETAANELAQDLREQSELSGLNIKVWGKITSIRGGKSRRG